MAARVSVALWLLAAIWFMPGSLATIEWVDEGHLVYFASRVAEGALPYRDFHHVYGPGTFFLNGTLLRLFGPDLLVVRLALVVVKATLSVAVAHVAARGSGASAGLFAWGLVLAVWGAPLWIFSTPYASTYQVTLHMLALVALLHLGGRPRTRALVVGACLGLAVTFKQTTGVFGGGAVLAFLLHEGRDRAAATGVMRGDPVAVVLRLGLLAGVLAVTAAYGASFAERRTLVLLGTPLAALLLWVALRVMRGGGPRDDLTAIAWTALGAAIAPALSLVYYAAHGAAAAFVRDLMGLPQATSWMVPLQPFDRRTAIASGIVVLGLAAVELARRGLSARGTSPRAWWMTTATALATLAMVAGAAMPGWPWRGLADPLLYWMPVAVTWVAVGRLLWHTQSLSIAAPTFMAAALLPGLEPAADLPHVLLALPVFLVPMAALTASYVDRGLRGQPLAAAAVVLLATLTVHPFVQLLARAVQAPRTPTVPYARATGVRDPARHAEASRALVSYLEAAPPEIRVLVIPSHQMLHFLAGRRSALEAQDFGLYVGTYELVPEETARRLVDEEAAIASLERQSVWVVRVTDPPQRLLVFRRLFPKLDDYIARRFHSVATFGPYQVLAPISVSGQPTKPSSE
jgi:Dolichyl-phosphate-mannose-protein mannosyltransferase